MEKAASTKTILMTAKAAALQNVPKPSKAASSQKSKPAKAATPQKAPRQAKAADGIGRPVRKTPLLKTMRLLYAHSGNRCAFDGCEQAIFDKDGNFVGQLCHIEAASPNGQRFNPDMNDDERIAAPNLVLLCYPHHQATNDVKKYPVQLMREIKRAHEAKYADPGKKIFASVVDHTKQETAKEPDNLDALWSVIGEPDSDELEQTDRLSELKKLIGVLRKIPTETRQFLAIAVERSKAVSQRNGGARFVAIPELKLATRLGIQQIRDHIGILDRARLFTPADDDEDSGSPRICIAPTEDDWDVWKDLKKFCKAKGIEINLFIEKLDFSPLAQ